MYPFSSSFARLFLYVFFSSLRCNPPQPTNHRKLRRGTKNPPEFLASASHHSGSALSQALGPAHKRLFRGPACSWRPLAWIRGTQTRGAGHTCRTGPACSAPSQKRKSAAARDMSCRKGSTMHAPQTVPQAPRSHRPCPLACSRRRPIAPCTTGVAFYAPWWACRT